MSRTRFALAVAALLAAGGASASDRADPAAAALTGSSRLLAHAFEAEGLGPEAARMAALIRIRAGQGETPGYLRFEAGALPFVRWDGNINGGVPGTGVTVAGIPFRIDPSRRAVSGALAGLQVRGGLVAGLGTGLAAEFDLGASLGHAPRHGLWKGHLAIEGCLKQAIDARRQVHACLGGHGVLRDIEPGFGLAARAGASTIVDALGGSHEITAELAWDQDVDESFRADRGQPRASLGVVSALARGAWFGRVTAGAPVEGQTALRVRVEAGFAQPLLGAPTSLSIAWEEARGGRFLGRERRDEVISLGLSRPLGERLSASLRVSRTRSTASILDGTSVDVGVSWRF